MIRFYHTLKKIQGATSLKKYTNELIIFMGFSIAIGGLSKDFTNNTGLIVGVSISAAAFSFFDLLANADESRGWSLKFQKLFLFLGVFSIIVVPYLPLLIGKLDNYTNHFTICSLSIVIILMGFRQKRFEKSNFEELQRMFNNQKELVGEQKEILNEKQKMIEVLQEQIKSKG